MKRVGLRLKFAVLFIMVVTVVLGAAGLWSALSQHCLLYTSSGFAYEVGAARACPVFSADWLLPARCHNRKREAFHRRLTNLNSL